jgi:potassium/sodium efflux P-type ATPase
MVAKRAWIPSKGTYGVGTTNEPFNPTEGHLNFTPKAPREIDFEQEVKPTPYRDLLENNESLLSFLKVASLANLATVHKMDDGNWTARGDPTEIAIQVLAARFQWNRLDFTHGEKPKWKQLAEFPFDSDVKKMSVVFEETETGKRYIFTKGAVERVIYSCSKIIMDESQGPIDMTDEIREDILANMESLAALGLRVLALAGKDFDGTVTKGEDISRDGVEDNLTFRGLVGLYDPPRPESGKSVRQCQRAGITVHMLTGDHPGTARAIAADVGILPSNMNTLAKDVSDAMVMTAGQFDKLSDDEIDSLPLLPLVIARCAPQTKVRMIEALHRRKAFAAMVSKVETRSWKIANNLPDWRRC